MNNFKYYRLLLIVFSFLLLIMSREALAIKCVDAETQSQTATQAVGSVAIPKTDPDGSMAWRSPLFHLQIQCWSDNGDHDEDVYLYTNPLKSTVGAGIQLGVVVNGQDFDDISQGSKWHIPGWTVSCPGGGTTSECKANHSSFYTIGYYVKVRKKGSASGTYQGSDTFAVFQLDGVGGLNVNGNYRFQITGLKKIRFIGCSANINVTPTIIDFGNILLPDTTSPDQFKDKKDFSITVSRSCNDPFNLTALYTTTAETDGDKVRFNGMYLKIFDKTRNGYVNFSDMFQLVDFANLTNVLSVTLPFSVELYFDGSVLTPGEYSPTVTVSVFYN